MLHRAPRPALRPFVETLWAATSVAGEAVRERVLPTGAMHLVIRLTDTPLRIYADDGDSIGRVIGCAVVGGVRASAYLRDISQPITSVGAMLRPGAAELLLGVPADELADRHTTLDELWGRAAGAFRDQLLDGSGSLAQQLDRFEQLLAARLPAVRGVHPAIAHALARFVETADVTTVVDETGYSHRRFIELFRRSVGLTPKLYCRVRRLQRALAATPSTPWVDVALDAGYSDQPHLVREFRELAGLTPSRFRALSPDGSRHVRIR